MDLGERRLTWAFAIGVTLLTAWLASTLLDLGRTPVYHGPFGDMRAEDVRPP